MKPRDVTIGLQAFDIAQRGSYFGPDFSFVRSRMANQDPEHIGLVLQLTRNTSISARPLVNIFQPDYSVSPNRLSSLSSLQDQV